MTHEGSHVAGQAGRAGRAGAGSHHHRADRRGHPGSQCEKTQVRGEAKGAALFGYTKLYGSVPGGQAPLASEPTDPLGLTQLTTHRLPLDEASDAYAMLQQKADDRIKVVLDPAA